MARRSTNTHAARIRDLPHVARMRREEPFLSDDAAEWKSAADRIAGPAGWYSMAGWAPADVDCKLIHFATAAEAEAMEHWIAESGIETRPPRGAASDLQGRRGSLPLGIARAGSFRPAIPHDQRQVICLR